MAESKPSVGLSEAAKMLGCSREVLKALIAAGEVPGKHIEGFYLLPRKALENWIQTGNELGGPSPRAIAEEIVNILDERNHANALSELTSAYPELKELIDREDLRIGGGARRTPTGG